MNDTSKYIIKRHHLTNSIVLTTQLLGCLTWIIRKPIFTIYPIIKRSGPPTEKEKEQRVDWLIYGTLLGKGQPQRNPCKKSSLKHELQQQNLARICWWKFNCGEFFAGTRCDDKLQL